MVRRRKRSGDRRDRGDRVPGYDDLADRDRDTGAPNRNRVVVAETRVLESSIGGGAGGAAARDRRPVTANYSHDVVIFMLNKGSISPRLAMAGTRFREQFLAALSSNVKAMDLEQPMGQGSCSPLYPSGGACEVSWARDLRPALEALGTPDAPMRLLAWHVLGGGKSLRLFAETVGWEGVRPRPVMAASGIMTSTLRTLADHYGLEG